MRLHDITPANPQTLIAARWRGGNGRILGPTNGPRFHLIRIERRTPPPLDATTANRTFGRQYWQPWPEPDWATPVTAALCGGFPTRAREVYITTYFFNTPQAGAVCENCRALAGGAPYYTYPTIPEPWYEIPHDQRRDAIDPVTGL